MERGGHRYRLPRNELIDPETLTIRQVFRVNSYHTTDLSVELLGIMTDEFRKWMPDHLPIWTEVGVRQLGAPNMRIEIEVSAYDPK